jgi:hypothetical protein
MTVKLSVPVIELAVSVAVAVCTPNVFSVAENIPVPAAKPESAGKAAAPSLLLKCTMPE